MLGTLKINTALFICSAFIFKFLFINVGSLHSDSFQNPGLPKSSSVRAADKQTVFDAPDNSKNNQFSGYDICEESSNDDEHFKLNIFLPMLVLYVLVSGKPLELVQKIIPSPTHFSYTSSQRYLLLQTFRI